MREHKVAEKLLMADDKIPSISRSRTTNGALGSLIREFVGHFDPQEINERSAET